MKSKGEFRDLFPYPSASDPLGHGERFYVPLERIYKASRAYDEAIDAMITARDQLEELRRACRRAVNHVQPLTRWTKLRLVVVALLLPWMAEHANACAEIARLVPEDES